MLGRTVDQHNPMVCRKATSEFACGHQPADAATQHDGTTGTTTARRAVGFVAAGRSYICWIAPSEPGLIELVLGEDDFPIWPNEDAPRDPAVRQRTEQLPLAVRDHGELEVELLLPGATGFVGLDRADVDDLEPVAREPLMEPDDGRTLLPTALSGRFPKDEQDPARPLDRQAQLRHRDRASWLNPSRESLEDLHPPHPILASATR